jgi:hypothetical protein
MREIHRRNAVQHLILCDVGGISCAGWREGVGDGTSDTSSSRRVYPLRIAATNMWLCKRKDAIIKDIHTALSKGREATDHHPHVAATATAAAALSGRQTLWGDRRQIPADDTVHSDEHREGWVRRCRHRTGEAHTDAMRHLNRDVPPLSAPFTCCGAVACIPKCLSTHRLRQNRQQHGGICAAADGIRRRRRLWKKSTNLPDKLNTAVDSEETIPALHAATSEDGVCALHVTVQRTARRLPIVTVENKGKGIVFPFVISLLRTGSNPACLRHSMRRS